MGEQEKRDDLIRSMLAFQCAQTFIFEYVLRHVWLGIPKRVRLDVAKQLLDNTEQTEWLRGLAQDEFQAMNLADMVVQMQQHVDQIVGRALVAIEKAEGGR